MNYLVLITENKAIAVSLKAIFKDDYLIEDVQPEYTLKVVSERRPRIILLDSQFSRVNSMELLAELLSYDPTLTIVKIVPSFDKVAKQSLELGAFEVVEKPFDIERIKHTIKRAIEREKFMGDRREDVIEKKKKEREDEDISFGMDNEPFFQSFLEIVAENFSDIKKTGLEVLKIIKKKFQFNRMLILLKDGTLFVPSVSLGIGDTFTGLELRQSHPLILWFLNKNRVLNLESESSIPFECKGFMETLNCRFACPLMTLKGELIGIFFAGDKITGGEITAKEIRSLSMIMDYLSTVFENAFLYREICFHKEYQEAIFHNIPTGIIAVDRDGRIVVFNPYAEDIFGIKFEDIKNEPIEKVGSQIADFIRRALNSGEAFNRVEIEYIPTRIILGLSTNVLRDANGVINGAVAIFQNLTVIKEIEKKEKDAERNRYWSSLASRLSHELKNPLVAIKTFAQMLPAQYNDEEFRENFSEVVQAEIQKINEIIERINKIADMMELKTVYVDIVELFKKCIEERDRKNSIKFIFSGEDKILVQSDVDKVKEAIGYIVEFIYDDIDGNGPVYINFRKDRGNLEIDIYERGNKINLQNEEEIFIPFSPSIKSTISIGIMLAKKIFESHGGRFRCNLQPSGKNLIITLPVSIPEGERNLAL
ncbi:MAG: PAS domain-containing protein [Candidatus Omnitrophica bacterium]|nr:PAS domain-containing protein [Candidatus Omnitrophota bacterium]